jgi:hypothetical protein
MVEAYEKMAKMIDDSMNETQPKGFAPGLQFVQSLNRSLSRYLAHASQTSSQPSVEI